jgi:predicted ATP-binding protein involved in virulence
MELDRLRHRLHNESIWEQTTYEELEYFERRAMVEGRNHRRLMYELRHDSSEIDTPKWFEEGLKKVNVQLIETQRIITLKESDGNSYVNNVKKCAEELSSMIEAAAKRSSEVTLSLDSTYPNRLIKKLKQGTSESFEDLNNALAKLDKRRKIFSSIGLVVDSKDSELLQIKENQKDLIKTLKLYVDDSHQKLDPYEDLSNKIKLFKQIVNKRFKHKKLVISHLNGMEFISTVKTDLKGKAESIPPSKLSSGEQNELILFYKLIFHSKNGDVILIDEPELSLHISWQNKFIKDLKEVTSINDVSIVIATHSPDIIDENWDLKVELLGIE